MSHRHLLVVVVLLAAGCRQGYVVDVPGNRVTFQTWDEGNGTRRFPVLGADAATFEAFTIPGVGGEFGRDARKVFERQHKIEWADPRSFRLLEATVRHGGDVFRDDRAVFMRHGGIIVRVEHADPDTFTRLASGVWRDRRRVFYGLEGFVPRDLASFRLLEPAGWSRDDRAFYWYGRELPAVDADSFRIDPSHATFARDATTVFWKGWPVSGCDPATFRPLLSHAGRTDREEWLFRVVDETSERSHRGPPRMDVCRRPLAAEAP